MKWITARSLTLLIAATLIAGCNKPQPPPRQRIDAAETIFVGGDIVTINDQPPSAEALAVKDGKILAVGTRAGAEIGPDQRIKPMEGMKSMTIWAAEQHGEQASKGSLETGKEGKTIYRAQQ